MLYEHYNNIDIIKELVSLGDVYILQRYIHPPLGVEHNVNKPYPNITIFYNRDCTNPDEETSTYPSFDNYLQNGDFQADNYVFDENKNLWFLIDKQNNNKLVLLSSLLFKDPDVSLELKNMINEEYIVKNMQYLEEKIPQKDSLLSSKKQKV